MTRPRFSAQGFSLAEVVIALGIIAFTLVALIGLFSGGLQSSKESIEEIHASHHAALILGQRRAAPVKIDPTFALPPLNDPVRCPILTGGATTPYRGVTYLARDGTAAASDADRYYRFDYLLSRDSAGRLATVHVSLVTPWQAVPPELQATGQTLPKTRFESVTFLPVPAS